MSTAPQSFAAVLGISNREARRKKPEHHSAKPPTIGIAGFPATAEWTASAANPLVKYARPNLTWLCLFHRSAENEQEESDDVSPARMHEHQRQGCNSCRGRWNESVPGDVAIRAKSVSKNTRIFSTTTLQTIGGRWFHVLNCSSLGIGSTNTGLSHCRT